MKLLRLVLGFYASICLIGAISLFISPKGTWSIFLGVYLLINAIIIFAGSFFEKRYKSKTGKKLGLKPTGERFINHTTGKIEEIYINPKTGEKSNIEI